MSKVLVYVNQKEGSLTTLALEAMAFGKQVATLSGRKLEALVIGSQTEDAAKEAIAYGAKTVYTIESSDLATYETESYIESFSTVFATSNADIFILPFDRQGKDVTGRLAVRQDAAVLTEVVDFSYKNDKLTWQRPMYGEKAIGEFIINKPRAIIAYRPNSFEKMKPNESLEGEIVPVDIDLSGNITNTKIVSELESSDHEFRLEDAKIIVAGGRGLGGPEGFEQLEKLAEALGGVVGATRAACDAGWVPSHLQIGQTGAIVSPDLYIAVGISGAGQHLSGIANAKHVVAINTDEEAPIFKRANYGIIGDYKSVIPALIEDIKSRTQMNIS